MDYSNFYKALQQNTAVLCNTKEKAAIFLNYADSFGKRWASGASYVGKTNWEEYGTETCYILTEGRYCDLQYYNISHVNILTFEDVITKITQDTQEFCF